MNKLIKLILVNIMGWLNYNNIVKEMETGVKGKYEVRAVLVVIVSLFYGYFLYFLFNYLSVRLVDKALIYLIGFVVSSIVCFYISFIHVDPIIFKSEDSEYLFSLPLTKHQIIFSKLFSIYIRNLFYVLIVMFPCILSYAKVVTINETIVLLYILSCLCIPFIPILFSVLVYYFNYLFKFKYNKIINIIIRIVLLIPIISLLYLFVKGLDFNTINGFFEVFDQRIRIIYPTTFLFVNIVSNTDLISFIIYLIINILSIVIYMYLISNQYRKICSMLKGIKLRKKFKYKRSINLGKGLGLLRKEILFVLNNKLYYKNSYGLLISLTIMFILGILFIDVRELIKDIDDFYKYYNLYCPFILAGLVSLGNSTINSMSLEKNEIEALISLPIKMRHILFYKWLCNVVICSLFILLYGTLLNIIVRPNKFVILMTYLLPLCVVMVVSLISLVLDYKFIVKNEINDGTIIKQRFISLVPLFISFIIVILPLSFNIISLYKNAILAFIVVCIITMLILVAYLCINSKKLRSNLIN